MTMISQSIKLTTTPLVTFYTLDFSTSVAFTPTTSPIIYLSPNRDASKNNLVKDGNTYNWVGVDVSGFRTEINGEIPAPQLTIDRASLNALTQYQTLRSQFTAQTKQILFDWRGVTFTRTRAHYPISGQTYPTEQYIVSQISKVTDSEIQVDLSVSLGADRLNSDSIESLAANRCSLRYRTWNPTTNAFDYVNEAAGGCPYGNPTTTNDWSAVPNFGVAYFTSSDIGLAAANKNLDQCSYSVKGCQSRFDPNNAGLTLPYTGLYSPASTPVGTGT